MVINHRLHKELVRGFLNSAKKMVKDKDGEIHITHKTAYPFSEWKIETLAEENGLCLAQEVCVSPSENLLLSFLRNG